MSEAKLDLEALYRDTVLEHYRRPHNRTPLESPDASALVHNPVCGDQVRVEVALRDGRIERIAAVSRGCSIAVASGSVMTELVAGGDATHVSGLAARLRALIGGAPPPPDLDDRLRAFARVADLPSRHRCALLAWEALEECLTPEENPR